MLSGKGRYGKSLEFEILMEMVASQSQITI